MALLAALGAFAALGPMLVSESVIRWIAIQQGTSQLESMAKTMLAHSEMVLDTASGALSSLSHGGVNSCTDDNIAFIGEAVFTNLPLKEIGVYDGQDRIRCTNFGPALVAMDRRNAIAVKGGQFDLSIIPTRIPGHNALGLRRDADQGEGGLAAIIETSAVLMELLHGELRDSCHARIELADGTLVGVSGQTRAGIVEQDPQMVEIRQASARFPVIAAVAAPRAALIAPFLRVSNYAKIGGGALGVLLLAFVIVTSRHRPTMEAEIDAALVGDEFVPYYQPSVDATEGRASGCEMLLRWQKPNGELVRPDVFIPFAEASGQIIPITSRMLRRVAVDLGDVCAEHPDFRVSINLVAEHFASSEIVEEVRRVFSDSTVRPENLVFEITERRPLNDLAKAKQVMADLQALGCHVALDDAGTGHSGLAYIQNLGMDAIKIDRMFIDAIGQDAAKSPVVDALIDLGHQLDMSIVAEGVETEEQFSYLRRRDVRYFQGFLFARPMPASSFRCFVSAFLPTPAGNAGAVTPGVEIPIFKVAAV
ncbi:MAG: EAL domain-containing protein [Rhizobiales bacterium]|nr:EAL domain-containing protein [Hyphomicrobiales bacterium]